AVQYTLPPSKLADGNAEMLRQVLYAENSPTNVSQDGLNDLLRNEDKSELQRRKDAVEKWKSSSAAPPQALVIYDADTKKQPHVFARGNSNSPGKVVSRQFLALLSRDARQPFQEGSGRLELARCIASPKNPLTA